MDPKLIQKVIKLEVRFGTPSKTTLDVFWAPLGVHLVPRWPQEEPEGARRGPLELQEAKKEHLEKVSFFP